MPDNTEFNSTEMKVHQMMQPKKVFPPSTADKKRLRDYTYNERLFMGDHFEAFSIKVGNPAFAQMYENLRYVMVNFAGIVSKVCADMLFSEQVIVRVPDGDQEFVDNLIVENNLHTQWYESALQNSYFGDAILKVRTGKRHRNDADSTVIIEDTTPRIYFPVIDTFNIRAQPDKQELAWVFNYQGREYLRKEIHEPGKIFNEVFLMKGEVIVGPAPLSILGEDLQEEIDTGIDRSLVQHIPNWKVGSQWNGISDYHDLDNLFFAINNRMTKIDNILDKHSDPILMVPEGILNEDGKPIKKYNKMIQMGDGENSKPEYVIWDASLENAFNQIDKLVEFFQMVSEISPDIFGMGKGTAVESGRALKLKLLRTIAKVQRKKLYYDRGIKESLFVAQQIAKADKLKVGGKTLSGDPVKPELHWQDGLPIDESEQVETESKALDAGITTKEQAIMRVYKVDEEAAKKIAAEQKKENELNMPKMNLGGENPFEPKAPVPPIKPPKK